MRAMSSGTPSRPSGLRDAYAFLMSAASAPIDSANAAAVRCVPGVSMLPGATALQRMRGASSSAIDFVSMTTAPFAAP